mgnify:CR=1 FL=1
MKRLLTATALAATMATSAFAASEAEEAAITMYYPDANFSVLSDDQVAETITVHVTQFRTSTFYNGNDLIN